MNCLLSIALAVNFLCFAAGMALLHLPRSLVPMLASVQWVALGVTMVAVLIDARRGLAAAEKDLAATEKDTADLRLEDLTTPDEFNLLKEFADALLADMTPAERAAHKKGWRDFMHGEGPYTTRDPVRARAALDAWLEETPHADAD